VCKKNTDDLYWFGPKNVLRSVGEKSPILSCTEVLVVGVTSGRERGRGSQVLRCEWSACSCDPSGFLARSRRVACLCVVSCLCEGFTTSLFCVSRMVHACSFYSLKEVQGYKMLCVREILVGEAASGPRGALSGSVVVGTVEAWCRYSWYCSYMVRHAYHCWREWFSVFRYYSNVPRHTWSCSRHGVSVLAV
jgi:hypothetical protein